MTHQEGQPEELVVSQAEQETIEEELLETVMGGGRIKDYFRNFCTNCIKPQTQEAASHPSSPEASVRPSSPDTGIRHPTESRNLTQTELATMTQEGIVPPLGERFKQHSVDFTRSIHLPIEPR
jgi:hypothetical protein